MFKTFIIAGLLSVLGMSEDLCPASRQHECQTDVTKGNYHI